MTETTEIYPGKELKALTVGIIGGTGAQGTGLGYRLAKAGFKVILGSRDGAKAVATAASFIPAGRAIKGASMAKKAVSTSIKKSVEKKSLKAANAPSKNQAASDSGRRYMGQKFMKVEDAGKDRYGNQKVAIKRNTEKLKEATTPRTTGGTVRLNPRFAKNLRKGR